MQYIALLRGINVGGNRKVEMKRLKLLLESMGFSSASTYLNSGNAIFESNHKINRKSLSAELSAAFGFAIPTLVKTAEEMKLIANAIPQGWQNNAEWKCDVAYLFDEIDTAGTIDLLPIQKEYVDIRYVKGAVFWRVERRNYNKSRLNKLISHKYYQLMTLRNVNTARFLGAQHPSC